MLFPKAQGFPVDGKYLIRRIKVIQLTVQIQMNSCIE